MFLPDAERNNLYVFAKFVRAADGSTSLVNVAEGDFKKRHAEWKEDDRLVVEEAN